MTASVLWTITLLKYNHALENLHTMDDFNFTNFFSDRVIGCSTKDASCCCFCKAVSNKYFQKVLVINFISTYANLLQDFISAHFLLAEYYGKCALRKESVIGPFIKRCKTATLRKS